MIESNLCQRHTVLKLFYVLGQARRVSCLLYCKLSVVGTALREQRCAGCRRCYHWAKHTTIDVNVLGEWWRTFCVRMKDGKISHGEYHRFGNFIRLMVRCFPWGRAIHT